MAETVVLCTNWDMAIVSQLMKHSGTRDCLQCQYHERESHVDPPVLIFCRPCVVLLRHDT